MRKLLLVFLIILSVNERIVSQPCFLYGITFTSQFQIDSFAIQYPNCTEIDGKLLISGPDITNLDGLSVLTSLNNDLSISGNPLLTDISGLVNVDNIGYKLIIENNPILQSLTGLDSIPLLNGECNIINNASLLSFEGLNGIQVIRGHFILRDNPRIKNMIGFDALRYVKFDFLIRDNDSLESFQGLDEFIQITGGLAIIDNDRLQSLDGFDNLYIIRRSLYIQDNPMLENISSLNEIEILEDLLKIVNNPSVDSIIGLNNLEDIGSVYIENNDSLVSLLGLSNLRTVGGLFINNNDNLLNLIGLEGLRHAYVIDLDNRETNSHYTLASLEGLNNLEELTNLTISNQPYLSDLTALLTLEKLDGRLYIAHNESLTSLYGLDNLNANLIERVQISNNPNLSTCEVESICDYLQIPGSSRYIIYNKDGCYNEQQVLDQCYILSMDNVEKSPIIIYPNPADNSINILGANTSDLNDLKIYNLLGVMVMHSYNKELKVDISRLKPGLYTVEIIAGKEKLIQKLIIL